MICFQLAVFMMGVKIGWQCFFLLLQIRIPTCYDKPGTSQLVQSAQVSSQINSSQKTFYVFSVVLI